MPLISAGGHPFSISSIDQPLEPSSRQSSKVSTAVLLIRVQKGVTARLYDLAVAAAGSDLSTRQGFPTAELTKVWIEGGYGLNSHLDYFQTLLLVAGGSGVSFTLPLMLDIVRRRRAMDSCTAGDSAVATDRLTFVWVVRSLGELVFEVKLEVLWLIPSPFEDDTVLVADALSEALALSSPGFLQVIVYCTKVSPASPAEGAPFSNSELRINADRSKQKNLHRQSRRTPTSSTDMGVLICKS